MNPFARAVRDWPRPQLKDFKKVAAEARHNIQTHVDYLAMLVSSHFHCLLDQVYLRFNWLMHLSCFVFQSEAHERQQDSVDRMSPLAVAGILTPPKSTEKPANA